MRVTIALYGWYISYVETEESVDTSVKYPSSLTNLSKPSVLGGVVNSRLLPVGMICSALPSVSLVMSTHCSSS